MALPFSYSLRNLKVRRTRTGFTVGVIALVVVAAALFLGLIHSLQSTLVTAAHPRNLVVMRKGSDNDGSSQLGLDVFQAVRFFDGIERDGKGEPLASPEAVVQPFFTTTGGVRENVLVRGVEAPAFAVHDVRIVEGRMFQPSTREAIVGRGAAGRYVGAKVGQEVQFGRGSWKVVGIFEAGGSSYESEVWVDARDLAADARKPLPYSGIRLRAAPGADIDALAQRINDDPRWALQAKSESAYYAELGSTASTLYVMVIGIALLAGTGAVFGATNTLYASVLSRTAEIGTLRALGFTRLTIARAFLLEALLIAVVGFSVGAAAAWVLALVLNVALSGIGFPMATFSTTVVSLQVGLADLGLSLLLALGIGLIGGFAPAVRASRMRPIEALRRV